MPNKEEADRFLKRALNFLGSAAHLSDATTDGWLPSACLLIGTAAELIAKKRLLERVEPEVTINELKRQPYGHDLVRLWKEHTDLFAEAEGIAKVLSNRGVIPNSFDLNLHFKKLAHAYGAASDFALRYPDGDRTFADPVALVLIVGEIARRERMR